MVVKDNQERSEWGSIDLHAGSEIEGYTFKLFQNLNFSSQFVKHIWAY